MRAAIYTRVSTEDQAERATIENQIEACTRYVEQHGWEITKIIKDEGISGAVPFLERPGGIELIGLAEHHEIERVVLLSVDRLARSSSDPHGHNTLTRLLAGRSSQRSKRGASDPWSGNGDGQTYVHYTTQSFDGTPAGKFMFTVFLAVAELERDMIAARTSAGRARRVRNGKYQAPITPYGFTYDSSSGQISPDPQTAPVVKEIFALALSGLGSKAIADVLNAKGIPTPLSAAPERHHPHKKPDSFGWNWGTVAKLLKARRYIGEGTYAGESMHCPAIIDLATYQRVQDGLVKRKSEARRNTKLDYLLQHMVWCRRCGSRYTAMTRAGGKQAYACHTRRVYSSSDNGLHDDVVRWWWPASLLEWPIKQAVNSIVTEPAAYLEKMNAQLEANRSFIEGSGVEVETLEKQLAALDTQQQRLVDAWTRELISEDDLGNGMRTIKAERATLTGRLKLARQTAADSEGLMWILEGLAAKVREDVLGGKAPEALIWDEELRYNEELREEVLCSEVDYETWHRVIREVVEKVWVEDDGSLTLEGPGESLILRDSSGVVASKQSR